MPLFSGPTEQTKAFGDMVEEFKNTFETPSEFINQKEAFITNIAIDEIIGNVKEAIRTEVDSIIQMEIKNLRTLKGKKEPKPPRPIKPKPEKLGPGEKPLVKIEVDELFADVL